MAQPNINTRICLTEHDKHMFWTCYVIHESSTIIHQNRIDKFESMVDTGCPYNMVDHALAQQCQAVIDQKAMPPGFAICGAEGKQLRIYGKWQPFWQLQDNQPIDAIVTGDLLAPSISGLDWFRSSKLIIDVHNKCLLTQNLFHASAYRGTNLIRHDEHMFVPCAVTHYSSIMLKRTDRLEGMLDTGSPYNLVELAVAQQCQAVVVALHQGFALNDAGGSPIETVGRWRMTLQIGDDNIARYPIVVKNHLISPFIMGINSLRDCAIDVYNQRIYNVGKHQYTYEENKQRHSLDNVV